ncbi:MAG: VOC family protein [Candidatus Saccharimonas sp.]
MTLVQKITPSLWFDGNAKEAVDFYTSVFPGSSTDSVAYYPSEGLADFQKDMAGKELSLEFTLAGHHFDAINAGPEFHFTAASSFMVNFDTLHDEQAREHLDEVWAKLADGGEVMMALGEYPFNPHYGWVKDRYGLSWQLSLTSEEGLPCIVPTLLFGGPNQNRTEEAIRYYLSVFKDTREGVMARYESDTGPAKAGSIMYANFTLENQLFAAMDSGVDQDFTFTEAVSYVISCENQEEIDYYWQQLSHVPASEQCGWCKDQFGVSWQIIPAQMGELMQKPDAFAHMMQMKKIVIADF